MRFGRLDLIRYGHFTGRSLSFPPGETDFHIVFGPNEAGKSTVRDAVADLLFGIPARSPYNFRHAYKHMRIGGVLESGGAMLEAVRRKGTSETLLDAEGTPLAGGEGVLRPFLAGADRAFMERMFSLNRARLETGGREILQAKDDIGQMLFSAGAGIGGLRDRLTELRKEADSLWSPRRAQHRAFYQASDKLDAAQREVREHAVPATRWRQLKKAYDEAQEAYEEIDARYQQASGEGDRLNRIRRVLADVRKKQELDDALDGLGDTIALPENAWAIVEEAERRDLQVATRIETIAAQLADSREAVQTLTFDETLIRWSDEIRELQETRAGIREKRADLPRRETELEVAVAELRDHARELGWPGDMEADGLIARTPARTKVKYLTALIERRGEVETNVIHARASLKNARESCEDLKRRLESAGVAVDVTGLSVAVTTVRQQGDIADRLRNAGRQLKIASETLNRRVAALHPAVGDAATLARIVVPSRAQVAAFRDRERSWKEKVKDTKQRREQARKTIDSARERLQRATRAERVPALEELNRQRAYRDQLWSIAKRRYITHEPVSEDEARTFAQEMDDLAGAFEPAVAKADEMADRRFDHAKTAATITELERTIDDDEVAEKQLAADQATLEAEREAMLAEWRSMWAGAGFEPLDGEAMLEWMDARQDVMEAISARDEAAAVLETVQGEERAARRRLLDELDALGIDTGGLSDRDVNTVLERAGRELGQREKQAEQTKQLGEDLKMAEKRVEASGQALQDAESALAAWRETWTGALGDIGLAADTPPEAVQDQIDAIDGMRTAAARIKDLRDNRIAKINRDIRLYEARAEKLLRAVGADLAAEPVDAAVKTLGHRLAEAEEIRKRRVIQDETIETLERSITELETERRELMVPVEHLKQAADATTIEALKEKIRASDRKRAQEQERAELLRKLERDGDGKTVAELEAECEGAQIDDIAARERALRIEIDDLRTQLTKAVEQRSEAREAFAAVGGDAAAAQASARAQEALAEMRDVAERYVRVETSAILLHWAIDRYRREKQAPLLRRASELFRIVTGGSFESLRVDYDENDNPELHGVRPDGEVVNVDGMSTGTADQLFLALRVAAIQDYLERAEPLPFVADDLFVNFDDDRAAAGFRLLQEMSRGTQVLFFTHNRHLVDIARRTCAPGMNVVDLAADRHAAARPIDAAMD